MDKKVKEEIKELIQKIEEYSSIFSNLTEKKDGFSIINKHINKSITESEEATKKLIENITYALSVIEENKDLLNKSIYSMEIEKVKQNEDVLAETLTEALTLLEFQDILAQRLKKISDFLNEVEQDIVKLAIDLGLEDTLESEKAKEIKKKLEELEWKREVEQTDVDEILKEHGM